MTRRPTAPPRSVTGSRKPAGLKDPRSSAVTLTLSDPALCPSGVARATVKAGSPDQPKPKTWCSKKQLNR
ncbi:hypothetical protein SRHO_G00255160 [Serrasalmus rhombeus]